MIWRCDLTPQYHAYKSEIDAAIDRVLRSGRYVLAGELAEFERRFAAWLGSREAVGVANGTDALILALEAVGAGAGDEVITTPFTAIPTVSAIVATGATPVFVDVCPDTFLMDVAQVAGAMTPRTKAILPVHIFGNAVDIEELRRVTGGRVPIIEDAAQAHGSAVRGRKCGTIGDLGAFSFYPTKNLGGYGDGGAVVTDNAEYAHFLRRRRMYGMVDKDTIDSDGINSRLDELQAAILSVKLAYLEEMNESRRRIAERYRRELRRDLFQHQAIAEDVTPNYHVFVSRLRVERDPFVRYLDEQSIQTNVYYPMPLYRQQPIARRMPGLHLPEVEKLCTEVIALPMYPEMDEELVTHIIGAINGYPGAA